jgi:hypothetical protein
MLQISENGQKRLLRPRNLQKTLFHNSALLALLRDKNSFVAHSLYIQRNVWDISHHFVIVLLFQSINLTYVRVSLSLYVTRRGRLSWSQFDTAHSLFFISLFLFFPTWIFLNSRKPLRAFR